MEDRRLNLCSKKCSHGSSLFYLADIHIFTQLADKSFHHGRLIFVSSLWSSTDISSVDIRIANMLLIGLPERSALRIVYKWSPVFSEF